MMFARVGGTFVRDRVRRIAALLVTAVLVAATSVASAQERGTVPPPDGLDAVGRRGFLYEVTRPEAAGRPARRLFLYGTIHVGRAGSEPFNRPLVNALRCSGRLALEADPSDAGATARLALALGQYPAGDRLDAHVPPALMARVRAYAKHAGMPAERVASIKPWLLANMIVLSQAGAAGLDPDLGSELQLVAYAHRAGLPVVEIEGLETQLRWLADLPSSLQVAELDEALADVEEDASSDDTKELFDLWLHGDRDAGDALADTMHREAADKVFGRYFVATLIDRRNRTMADRAEALLDQRGDTFFAVGSLHLFGPTGLLREFVRRGERVVDLQDTPDRALCDGAPGAPGSVVPAKAGTQ